MSMKKHCPVCGSLNVAVKVPKEYSYDHIGMTGVKLVGNGVRITTCNSCNETTTCIQSEQQLLQLIGMMTVFQGPGMNGEQLKYLRSVCNISQADLASTIGKRRPTIAEWEAKGTKRIFAKPFDELPLRLVVIELFLKHVIQSEYCFLDGAAVAAFMEFRGEFLNSAMQMLVGTKKSAKPTRVTVKHQRSRTGWVSPEICTVC